MYNTDKTFKKSDLIFILLQNTTFWSKLVKIVYQKAQVSQYD